MEKDFDSDWLELRFEADSEARKNAIDEIKEKLVIQGPVSIIDIGSGTGNNVFYLIPELVKNGIEDQRWLLVDRDPKLLDVALERLEKLKAKLENVSTQIDILVADLSDELDRIPFGDADIVALSELLDLVSRKWIEKFVKMISEFDVRYVLISLTVDGMIQWSPKHPMDKSISDLFNQDMLKDKGFGPALGMNATEVLKEYLMKSGYGIKEMDTPWILESGQKKLQGRYLEDMTSAVLTGEVMADKEEILKWKNNRKALIQSGESQLRVGHTDIVGIRD
jgi:SAM-dependent methyltransferase